LGLPCQASRSGNTSIWIQPADTKGRKRKQIGGFGRRGERQKKGGRGSNISGSPNMTRLKKNKKKTPQHTQS